MAKIDKLVRQAQEHLDEGEELLVAVDGTYETSVLGADTVRKGILAATDRRLLFYAKKVTGFDLESFPYGTISSFERSKSMLGEAIKFYASGNTVSMKWIQSKNLEEFVSAVKAKMDEAHRSPAQPATADVADQLRKLAELRESGILSEDEFAAKKAELLDRM